MKKNTKKLVALLTLSTLAVGLTGCAQVFRDPNHAYAEVKTEDGRAWICETYNTRKSVSVSQNGLELAIENGTRPAFEKAGEKVTIHFVCETCGTDETVEIVVPDSKVLSCDCPEYDELTKEEQKECKNSKEYIAFSFVVQPEEMEETEK